MGCMKKKETKKQKGPADNEVVANTDQDNDCNEEKRSRPES